jgi:hypothetical protein
MKRPREFYRGFFSRQACVPDLNSPTERRDSVDIQLSDHFTYRRLMRFSLPSIIMMIFISSTAVVVGLFVPIWWA